MSGTDKMVGGIKEGSDQASPGFRKPVWTRVHLIWTLKSELDLDMW